MLDIERLQRAYRVSRDTLCSLRAVEGHWVGELASSALSTATAISALTLVGRNSPSETIPRDDATFVQRGVEWLVECQNEDGGWGDTVRSHSNISTTMLVVAALRIAGYVATYESLIRRGETYAKRAGWIEGLVRRYGRDKTFAVPILTNCALAGMVDWRHVSPLPFELAVFPQSLYRFLGLPVVSYAIPALVAIGQASFFHQTPRNPLIRWIRSRAVEPSLRVLGRMQPASGGYLEAVPLISFVVMSLASMKRANDPVAVSGARFIRESFRSDGSWPIDTNLATWLTSLSLHAFDVGGEDLMALECWPWLLRCQHKQRHPFTGADPGGWGWTDLSGAVPDADDTPAALLAIDALLRSTRSDREQLTSEVPNSLDRPTIPNYQGTVLPNHDELVEAGTNGIRWLLDLQNSDGGWPTFCRGWGKLPFDRSGADLTAHALRALHCWRNYVSDLRLLKRMKRAQTAGLRFLPRVQRADGSWVPLWFGNQDHNDEENPVYGTSKVLAAFRDLGHSGSNAAQRGFNWIESNIGNDGGWGEWDGRGESNVEETALAVDTLLSRDEPWRSSTLVAGLDWLMRAVETNRYLTPSPIGFYFAKLWYYEKLYPVVFTVTAIGRALRLARASKVA